MAWARLSAVAVAGSPALGGTSAKSGGTISGCWRATANSSGRVRFSGLLLQPASSNATAVALKTTGTLRILNFLPRFPFARKQGADNQQQDADGNRSIANIEDQKGADRAEMQIGIIKHIAHPRAIDNIAQRPAQDHAKRNSIVAVALAPQPQYHTDREAGGQRHQQPAAEITLRGQQSHG